MPHPLHASGFVMDASSRFPGESDRHHFYYQLVCHQDARRFRLLKGNKQTVKAICARCGNEIIVYDLSYYPAASKNPGTEQFTSVRHPSGDESLRVYVMYEYGELDEDEVFDPNEITWCQIFIEDELGNIVKILDDETA